MFETDIKRILLYNYKIERLPVVINQKKEDKWWISDEITKQSDGNYKVDIALADSKNDKHILSVIFKEAEIERCN